MNLPNTRKVLPLVYDECLSYYEQLLLLINRINLLNDDINNLESETVKIANSYTDNKISNVIEQIEKVETDLTVHIDDIEKSFNNELLEIKNITETQINDLKDEFKTFKTLLEESVIKLTLSVNELYLNFNKLKENNAKQFEQLEKELIDIIEEQIATKSGDFILTVNPITGKVDDLTTVLKCIYNEFIILGGITALQFDNMHITALEFDSLKITANMFDVKGFFIFFDRIKLKPLWDNTVQLVENVKRDLLKVENLSYIISPFTGLKTLASKVINQLADLHKNCYTAIEYDSIGITAENYDKLNITAYDYDWNSKNIF